MDLGVFIDLILGFWVCFLLIDKANKSDIVRYNDSNLKQKIKNRAQLNLNMPSFNSYESLDQQLVNIKNSIEWSIQACIENAVDGIIDELYTHEDFERDIGLKD